MEDAVQLVNLLDGAGRHGLISSLIERIEAKQKPSLAEQNIGNVFVSSPS